MLTNRIPYKFFFMLLVFGIVLVAPVFLIVGHNLDMMLRAIESVEILFPEQRAAFLKYTDRIIDDLVTLSFYVFVLAFVVSLFFSKRFLAPIRELFAGAQAIKAGNLDVELDITTNDELGEVTRSFNDIVEDIRSKSVELARKNHYVLSMLDPLWVVDEDNRIIDVNPAFTAEFGYERAEVLGASAFDFLDEDSEKLVRRQFYQPDPAQGATADVAVITKSAAIVPVRLTTSRIVEDDTVLGKIGVMRDLRTEAGLRAALKAESGFSGTLLDSIQDKVVVVDRDFAIRRANLAARVAAGRELGGRKCHDVFHGKTERCYMHGEDCPVKQAFERKQSFSATHEHVSANGGRATFNEVTAYPILSPDGEVVEVIEIISDVTEHRKYEDEIEERNRELTTIYSISRLLAQSLKADEIFNRVLDRVIGLMSMDGGGIFFLDESGRDLLCRYNRGMTEDFIDSIGRIRVGYDLIGRVAVDGQPILSPDVSRDRRAESSVLRHTGFKAFACLPIRGKERLIGVFFIFSVAARAFSPEEESTLSSISEMTGIAFENIRLFEGMKDLYESQRIRRAEDQKNLLDIAGTLSSSLDMKNVLGACLGLVKSACRADAIVLLSPDEDGSLVMKSGDVKGIVEGDIVYRAGVPSIEAHAAEAREPVRVKGIASEARFTLHDALKGYGSVYAIPMFIGGKSYGVFSLYYSIIKSLGEDDIHFLQTVGSVLAVALEREGLYQHVIIQRGMSAAILQSIADGVVSVDNEGDAVSLNAAAESVFGIHADEVAGLPLVQALAGGREGNSEFGLRLEECLAEARTGKVASFDAEFMTADARRIPLTVRGAPVRDDRGGIAGVVFVTRDLSREMEVDALKSDFLRSVSHEFRTPLTAIVGMAEMIIDGDVAGPRQTEYLRNIHTEGLRLSSMVSSVLDVARIESGKEVVRESTIDWGRLMSSVRGSFETVIGKRDISYSETMEDGIGDFRGDEEKLKQLLRNLIDNAVSYSDPGASVAVHIGGSGGDIRITVRDRGWGMTPEELDHAGERFYRGARARTKKGTGLGLALSRDIARMHGGVLAIESAPGKGTTVTVELKGRPSA